MFYIFVNNKILKSNIYPPKFHENIEIDNKNRLKLSILSETLKIKITMNTHSLKTIISSAQKTVKRFTSTWLCAVIICITLNYTILFDTLDDNYLVLNLVLSLTLGISLFFALDIWSETRKNTLKWRVITNSIGYILLILYYFTLPTSNDTNNTEIHIVYYIIYCIILHLLVSIAPALSSKTQHSFWSFNKNLFIRFWVSLLYAGVIYIGITLALLSLKYAFNISIEGEIYLCILILCASIINIWIFLSGIDVDLFKNDKENVYPKGLKIFTQYILLPLLLIYLVIIYAYGIQVLITGDWPNGKISLMIIGVAILGYLTNLLLFPIAYLKQKNWLKTFYKVLYYLMIPLAVLILYLIYIRINEYGFTIHRYYVLLIGIWIFFTSIYQIIQPGNIKVIPISLTIFISLSTFGFWSMENVSERSQVNHLREVLTEVGVLKQGKLLFEYDIKTDSLISESNTIPTTTSEKVEEIESTINYLGRYHGFKSINPWFKQDLEEIRIYKDSSKIDAWNLHFILGLNKFHYKIEGKKNIRFYNSKDKVLQLNRFDYYLEYSIYYSDNNLKQYNLDDKLVEVELEDCINLGIRLNGEIVKTINLVDFTLDLNRKYPSQKNDPPKEEFILQFQNDSIALKVCIYTIKLTRDKSEDKIIDIDTGIFVKIL
ncbi:DUF4153 domain-containing protein [Flammeovirga aprica]|uniref:DUF4153 domain-containing protein n=1 Tax=Flammeovirga aprica JL-4 TaxID=694437 RepID=A0A7X9P3L1_9BACT|nr:DUF4153 domain-containing protein [Flammeovirga aprica]NME68054.1 DUF4153 domain-containing protein [Flammeovirga aprica JL-4]